MAYVKCPNCEIVYHIHFVSMEKEKEAPPTLCYKCYKIERTVMKSEIKDLIARRREVMKELAKGAKDIQFLSLQDVTDIFNALLEEFGGSPTILSQAALESAVVAPQNTYKYGESSDMDVLAASYMYHICQAHAFEDGNKRVAVLATELFLERNGYELFVSDGWLVEIMLKIASGIWGVEQTKREISPLVVYKMEEHDN